MEYLNIKEYDKTDPKSIEEYAKQLIGHTFREVASWNVSSRVEEHPVHYWEVQHKGGMGNFIEEQFFGYKANSDSEADFSEAGVELKVTPYEKKTGGKLSAGERLVLTMISYADAIEPEFKESHLWKKCALILLIYYLRDRRKSSRMDYRIDYASLFTPPEEDLAIIMQDYKVITDKIAAGKADELSESDTMYLGACTKGTTAEKSTVPQYYYAPDKKARRRAFCFKTSYMTYVLNNYLVPGKDTYEPIVKDATELKQKTFEQIIKERIERHVGMTDEELCIKYDREYNNNKAQWIDLTYRMLGIKSSAAEEFEKAQIVVKAIRIEENGAIRENSSLPPFKFKELASEDWEDSSLFTYFDETRFLFVVYKRVGTKYVLRGCQLWNMPYEDLHKTVYQGWKEAQEIIRAGVQLTVERRGDSYRVTNNLPGSHSNRIIHIRPHASKAFYLLEDGSTIGNGSISDSDELPDGRRMTKQSFWLNNSYIIQQLEKGLVE